MPQDPPDGSFSKAELPGQAGRSLTPGRLHRSPAGCLPSLLGKAPFGWMNLENAILSDSDRERQI